MTIFISIKGGPGSGNWGHRGIPGKVGGSSPRGAGMSPISGRDWLSRYEKRVGKKHPTAPKGLAGVTMDVANLTMRNRVMSQLESLELPDVALADLTITDKSPPGSSRWRSDYNGWYDYTTNTVGVKTVDRPANKSLEDTLTHEIGHHMSNVIRQELVPWPTEKETALRMIGNHLKQGIVSDQEEFIRLWKQENYDKKLGLSITGLMIAGEFVADAYTASKIGTTEQKSNWSRLLQAKNTGELDLSIHPKFFADANTNTPVTLDEFFDF